MKTVSILSFAIALLIVSCGENESSTKVSTQDYNISSIDSTENDLTIKAIITERLSKEDIIKITYSEKQKRDWQNKLVVYFFLHSTNNNAYATASYFKDCSNCNSIDPSNNRINVELNFGDKTQSEKEKFSIPKEINKELLVVAFHDEILSANVFIVHDGTDKKKASKIIYFSDGGKNETNLVVVSPSIFRELFEDFPEDKIDYKINGEFVEYVYPDGKAHYTYPILK